MALRRPFRWTRWAPLLALTAALAGCGAAATPTPAAPAERQATCDDSAIRLVDRGAGIHGAIVADTLHMGGATAPATCMEPANQSLEAGSPMPDGGTEQAQQSRYYLIVINYPGGNRLYVISSRADGSTCVVDLSDQCIAQVIELPDDFDLKDLPEDVAPTIPAGRPAPPTVSPPPGGGDSPAGPGAPLGGDSAPPSATGTPPGTASNVQPPDGATRQTIDGPLLIWVAAPRALSYDLYWGTTKDLGADTDRGTPINTSSCGETFRSPQGPGCYQFIPAYLEYETLYYWRVDAKNEAGITRGNVWSFTTEEAPSQEGWPTLSISADESIPEGDEGYTVVRFEISLSSPVTDFAGNRHVVSWMIEGTATRDVDYLHPKAGLIRFRDCSTGGCGRRPIEFDVFIYGDREKEEDETLYLEVRPVGSGERDAFLTEEHVSAPFPAICGRCRAKVTIIDDD